MAAGPSRRIRCRPDTGGGDHCRASPADLMVIGGLEIMRTAPVWSRGRTVMVGDAAHVPSPSSGQGASLAIESAVELARCLRDLPYANGPSPRTRTFVVIGLPASSNSRLAPTVTRPLGPIAQTPTRRVHADGDEAGQAGEDRLAVRLPHRLGCTGDSAACARTPGDTGALEPPLKLPLTRPCLALQRVRPSRGALLVSAERADSVDLGRPTVGSESLTAGLVHEAA